VPSHATLRPGGSVEGHASGAERIHASRGCYRGGGRPRHTVELAMSADTILAIDLGRYKSVACVYTRSTRAHTFRTIDTTPDDLGRLLARHPGAVVVVEACANAGWVHDLAAAGHGVKVANTAAEAWKFQHLKRKTD